MLLYFSLAILILLFGASLFWRRSFGNNRSESTQRRLIFKGIFFSAIILIFILLFYQSHQQFQIWSQNEVSQYLLPPHRSINYFIFYVLARFFAPYLISLAVAILFLFSAKALNKKYQERFFHPEEPYFGAMAIFVLGHPGWLFYSLTILTIAVIGSVITRQRFSLYYYWIPVAICVILLIKLYLSGLSWWSVLKI